MAVQFVTTTGSTALVAATAKTVIEVTTTANIPPEWVNVDISFNGVNAANTPVLVDFCTYAATGTGTAYTPKKFGQSVGVAGSTVKINDTVEPTTPTILFSWFITPTSGLWYPLPLGRELFQPVSTIQGIRLTAPQVVNYIVNLTLEE